MNVRFHDQNEAAKIAKSFSESAFIKQDFSKSLNYMFTVPNTKESYLHLEQLIKRMHPTGIYPKTIKAEEYEIPVNSPVIRIYLQGVTENNEKIFYCIVLMQNDKSYKVSEIYRNKQNEPYPLQNGLPRKPL